MEFASEVIMPANEFLHLIQKSSIVSEAMIFSSADGKLRVESEGDLISFSQNIDAPIQKEFRVKFSTEYLIKLEKFFKKGNVTIGLSSDYPLRVEDDKGSWIILAPRVDDG